MLNPSSPHPPGRAPSYSQTLQQENLSIAHTTGGFAPQLGPPSEGDDTDSNGLEMLADSDSSTAMLTAQISSFPGSSSFGLGSYSNGSGPQTRTPDPGRSIPLLAQNCSSAAKPWNPLDASGAPAGSAVPTLGPFTDHIITFLSPSKSQPRSFKDSGFGTGDRSQYDDTQSQRSRLPASYYPLPSSSQLDPEEVMCLDEDSYETVLAPDAPTQPRKGSRQSTRTKAELSCPQCGKTAKTPSDMKGFATLNDLHRHQKSVHQTVTPGSRSYKCFAPGCSKSDKIWPRLDNFKQHLKRLHKSESLDELISLSDEWYDQAHPNDAVQSEAVRNQVRSQERMVAEERKRKRTESQDQDDEGNRRRDRYTMATIRAPSSQAISLSSSASAHHRARGPGRSPTIDSLDMYGFEPQSFPWTTYEQAQVPAPSMMDRYFLQPQQYFFDPKRNQPRTIADLGDLAELRGQQTELAWSLQTSQPYPECDLPTGDLLAEIGAANFNPLDTLPETSALPVSDPKVDSRVAPDSGLNLKIALLNFLDAYKANPSGISQLRLDEKDWQLLKRFCEDVSGSNPSMASGSPTRLNPHSSVAGEPRARKGAKCEICAKVKKLPSDLRKHLKRHSRPYGCVLDGCFKRFGSKNDWKRHEGTHPAQAQCFRCDGAHSCPESGNPCKKAFYVDQAQYCRHLLDCQVSPDQVNEIAERRLISDNYQKNFWCGFCDDIVRHDLGGLAALTKRHNHIDSHFQENALRTDDWIELDGFDRFEFVFDCYVTSATTRSTRARATTTPSGSPPRKRYKLGEQGGKPKSRGEQIGACMKAVFNQWEATALEQAAQAAGEQHGPQDAAGAAGAAADIILAAGIYKDARVLLPADGPGSLHHDEEMEMAAAAGFSEDRGNLADYYVRKYRTALGFPNYIEFNKTQAQMFPRGDVNVTSRWFSKWRAWGCLRRRLIDQAIAYEDANRACKQWKHYPAIARL
ncbi:hypothetical protein DV735_g964, partial [Chaetothyriales sp. CBS 134920]